MQTSPCEENSHIVNSDSEPIEELNFNPNTIQRNDNSPNGIRPSAPETLKIGLNSPKKSPFESENQETSSYIETNQVTPSEVQQLADITSSPEEQTNISIPLNEPRSFMPIPLLRLDSEGDESNNRKNKIYMINLKLEEETTECKPLPLQIPPVRLDLSLLLGGDVGVEAGDNDNPNQPVWIRTRKNKAGAKVTFDDSLNTDIIYDPNESCLFSSTRTDSNKDTITTPKSTSDYSQQTSLKNEDDDEQTPKERRKNSPNIEFRFEKHKDVDSEEEQLSNDFQEGIDNDHLDEAEEQTSEAEEQSQNNTFQGLKKLDTTKSSLANKSPQARTISDTKGLAESKDEVENLLIASDAKSANTSKPQGLFTQILERRKSASDKERNSLAPQKMQRTAVEFNEDEQIKALNIKSKRNLRSFSQEELKSGDIKVDTSLLSKSALVGGTKMIDEMFKLAREDIQKRIASIDKRLIENACENISKRVLREESNKGAKAIQSPEIISISTSDIKQRSYTDGPERESVNINDDALFGDELLPKIKSEQQISESQKKRQKETQPKESKIGDIKKKLGGSQERTANKQNLKDSYTIIYPKEKEKSTALNKTELAFLSNKEKYTRELINKGLQQAAQTPEASFDYEKKKPKFLVAPTNKQTKFPSMETLTLEGLSYSQIHEKEKKSYLSPKTNDRLELPKENTKIFKQLENVLRTYALKESPDKKKNLARRTPVKVTEMRDISKELQSYKINIKSEGLKTKDKSFNPEVQGEKKETIHFTLRPQSAEKAYDKKTNNSFTQKPLDQTIRNTPTPTKDSKEKTYLKPNNVRSPVINDKYLHTIPVQDLRIPKSQSDHHIKALKPNKPPQTIPNDAQDFKSDLSLSAAKPSKSTTKLLSPKNKVSDSPRTNKLRGLVSPSVNKSLSKSLLAETDHLNVPKAIYLKSLFSVQKLTPTDMRQARRNQNKSCTSSLNAEHAEELLKQNHKVIGIRNNQYVFAKYAS